MKMIILFLVSSIVLISSIRGQSCLPEGIKFTTQEQVDSFQTDYPNCSVIEGYIELNGPNISSLTGLSSITKIMGDLLINGTSIADLEGLDDLSKIGRDLVIVSNDMLTNLSGLGNLDSVCGNLTIGWNDLLSSLSEIDSINPSCIQNLYIRANNSLSQCNVESICLYLNSPNGTVYIFDNASDCNSIEVVEDICLSGIQDNSTPKFSIYPNPATEIINISIENNEPVEQVWLYNQFGQLVRHFKQDKKQINIANLQPGIYYIELELKSKTYKDVLLIQ